MGIGEKIQRIRKERGYTAEKLAGMLGISVVSLRKYEYGERMPKEQMIDEIARCLGVSPSTLKADWGSNVDDAIHVLFDLEEEFCLEPVKIGQTIVLSLPEELDTEEQEALAKAMHHWYRNKRDFRDDELTHAEYVAWKDSFRA